MILYFLLRQTRRKINNKAGEEKVMSGRTGEICKVSGVYRCSTHTSNTIPLAINNKFPPCSSGSGHATTWVLVNKA